jgi:hippurate hydrolase
MKYRLLLILFGFFSLASTAQNARLNEDLSAIAAGMEAKYRNLYTDLHRNPELSLMESKTAARMAEGLKELGFTVTTQFGGNGVVGIFRNGPGRVIMLRTDMDALPIKENTGLSFSSTVTIRDSGGAELPVMHACGHDLHMSVWLGTLSALVSQRKEWKGTILAVAEPAEEISGGAENMISGGLFTKFPVPDAALCFHVSPLLPAGTIGYCPGPVFAGVGTCNITVYGRGGHGAMPHKAIDPIVLSSRIILDLQTIVSRETNPLTPAVVTVGTIIGGTKSNIIPDDVKMSLTLRYFDDNVYEHIREAIVRITKGDAIAAGLPAERMPLVEFSSDATPPVLNNEPLVMKTVAFMKEILGDSKVIRVDPATVAEDFGQYGRTAEKIPVSLFWLGGVKPEKYRDYLEKGTVLPYLHSSQFAPDFDTAWACGVKAMSRAMIGLFGSRE